MAIAVLLSAAAAAGYHAYSIRASGLTDLALIGSVGFLGLATTSILTYLHRDVPVPRAGTALARRLDGLRVTVIVPAHNEDPLMLRAMLDSVAGQTRLPARIHLVENGDPAQGYTPKLQEPFERWVRQGCPRGVEAIYTFSPIARKRDAQAVAIAADQDADIYMTLDSDVKLAPGAIAAGIVPFRRGDVMSVGGLLLGLNRGSNLLTRLIEPSFVCASLNGRVAQSMLGSVAVNSGGLAFYRGGVMRSYAKHYLSHTVAGRLRTSGDDSMMTRYAMMEGKTLFQIEAWGYTLHPERLGQLTKQRVRWWRNFWWGNVWLLRTFSPARLIWWRTVSKFVSFVWLSVLIPLFLVSGTLRFSHLPWQALLWFIGISYVASARYLTLRRPGANFVRDFSYWALVPLSTLLNLYLGLVLCYVGLVTYTRNGWSSRSHVLGLGLPGNAPGRAEPAVAAASRATSVTVADVSTLLFPRVNGLGAGILDSSASDADLHTQVLPRFRDPQPVDHKASTSTTEMPTALIPRARAPQAGWE